MPSTNVFVASPQPTASIAVPPVGRRTIAPPVAASPPEYWDVRRRRVDPEAVREQEVPARLDDVWPAVQPAFFVTVAPELVT